jgi:hypothetical protein
MIHIDNPLAGKASQKNDLSIAPMDLMNSRIDEPSFQNHPDLTNQKTF